MKTHFRSEICTQCGKKFDPCRGKCPNCGKESVDFNEVKGFATMTPMGWGKELALFLTGWAGLQLLMLAMELIALATVKGAYVSAGLSGASLSAALKSFEGSVTFYEVIDFSAYVILFCLMLVILDKDLYRLTKKFKEGKTYFGLIFGVGIMGFSMIYGIIVRSCGLDTTNNNQSIINDMVADSPLLCLVIFGLIGPFVEELTYRVGLFGILKRVNVYFAYILVAIIFGLIHFDWQNPTITEWVYLPDYMISGVLFAFVYDKFGFGASYLAHAFNNFTSIFFTILANLIKK
jgi:membrane protease YdiL (CAAX protease family)